MHCLHCGGVNNRPRSKYCSNECYNKAYSKRYYERNKKIIPIVDRVCEYCGGVFTPNERTKTVQKYCSIICQRRALHKRAVETGRKKINAAKYRERRREKIREMNQEYKNEYFFSGNKEKVLARDGYKCVKCGSTDSLVVHHKDETGLSTVGEREHVNNELDNLISLCRACHIKIHHPEPPNKKHLTKEQIVAALEGRSVQEAAKILGVTRKTLLLKRKQYGLELRETAAPMERHKPVTKEQVVQALESCKTLDEAAKMLGISRAVLHKRRIQFGLPMRR